MTTETTPLRNRPSLQPCSGGKRMTLPRLTSASPLGDRGFLGALRGVGAVASLVLTLAIGGITTSEAQTFYTNTNSVTAWDTNSANFTGSPNWSFSSSSSNSAAVFTNTGTTSFTINGNIFLNNFRFLPTTTAAFNFGGPGTLNFVPSGGGSGTSTISYSNNPTITISNSVVATNQVLNITGSSGSVGMVIFAGGTNNFSNSTIQSITGFTSVGGVGISGTNYGGTYVFTNKNGAAINYISGLVTNAVSWSDNGSLTISNGARMNVTNLTLSGVGGQGFSSAPYTLTINSTNQNGPVLTGLTNLTLGWMNMTVNSSFANSNAMVIDTNGNSTLLNQAFSNNSTLTLNNASTNATNATFGGATLTLNAGTVAYSAAGSSNTLASIASLVVAGPGVLTAVAGSGGNNILQIGSITNQGFGTLYTSLGGNDTNPAGRVAVTTAPTLTNGILPWAVNYFTNSLGTFVGFVTVTNSGGTNFLGTFGTNANLVSLNSGSATDNTTVTANTTNTLTGNKTVNSLTFNQSTADLGGNTLTLASGGLLFTLGNSTTLTNGFVTAGSTNLYLWQNNGATNTPSTISAAIVDNGVGAALNLIKSGTGAIFLTGTNTYTGQTIINGGQIYVGNAAGTGWGNLNTNSISIAGTAAQLMFYQTNNITVANITARSSASGAVNAYGTGTVTLTGTNNNFYNANLLNVFSGASVYLSNAAVNFEVGPLGNANGTVLGIVGGRFTVDGSSTVTIINSGRPSINTGGTLSILRGGLFTNTGSGGAYAGLGGSANGLTNRLTNDGTYVSSGFRFAGQGVTGSSNFNVIDNTFVLRLTGNNIIMQDGTGTNNTNVLNNYATGFITNAGGLLMGNNASAVNVVNIVTNAGSMTNTGVISLGATAAASGSNIFAVTTSGTLNATTNTVGLAGRMTNLFTSAGSSTFTGSFFIGNGASNTANTAQITGGTLTISGGNGMIIGYAGSSTTNTYSQSGGSASNTVLYVGAGNGSSQVNQFLITGGSFTNNSFAQIGGGFGVQSISNTLNVLSNGGGYFRVGGTFSFGPNNISNVATASSGGITNQLILGNGTLGAGTTTLNVISNNYTNTFTGYTNQIIWNGGVLQAGTNTGATFLTNLPNTLVTIRNAGGIFDINGFNNTIAANIGGTGALTVTNSSATYSTLTLSGSNTFNGLTLNAATAGVTAGSSNAFGIGTLTLNGGTLNLGGFTFTNTLLALSGTLTNGAYNGMIANAFPNNTFTNSGVLTLGVNVTGSGLIQNGNGTTILAVSNSYTGGTLVSAGTLQITGTQTVTTNTAITNNATLLFGSSNTTVSAFTVNGGQTLTLTGTGTTVFNSANNTPFSWVNAGATLLITNTTLINTNAVWGIFFGNAAGTTILGSSTLNGGGGGNGVSVGANETLIIAQGSVITNSFYKPLWDNSTLVLTNGGLLYATSQNYFQTRSGTNSRLIIGSSVAGLTSTLFANSSGASVGAWGNGSNNLNNNLIQVDAGGLVTNSGTINIGGANGNDAFNSLNQLLITNGGQLYMIAGPTAPIRIGQATNDNSNSVAVAGRGSLLDMSGNTINVGMSTNTGVNYGNNLQVLNGAVLTNASTIWVDNSNSYVIISGATVYSTGMVLSNATTSLTISNNGTTNGALIARGNGTLLTGSGTVTLGGGAEIDAGGFSVTNSVRMGGTGTLTVNGTANGNAGTGTLTLSASNSYTGGTLLNGGTLVFTTNTAFGTGTVSLANNSSLIASNASGNLANAISGGGSLTVGGTGTLTLSGSNSHTGGTLLTSGRLNLGNSNAIGTGTLALNGGTLDETLPSDLVITNALSLGGGVTYVGSGNLIQTNGSITLASNSTLTVSARNLTLAGNISESVAGLSLGKAGNGTLTLSGSNNYTGGTTLSAGVLNLGNSNAIGTGTLALNGGTLDETLPSDLMIANALSLGGGVTYVGSGNLIQTNGSITLASNSTLTVSARNLTLAGNISESVAGLSLGKAGNGTLTLSGSNNYTGGTTLSAGVLSLQNAGALGSSGTITMGAGTLQFSSANSTDYSTRFSTSSIQTLNFDLAGQNVTFASTLYGGRMTLNDSVGTGTLTLAASNNLATNTLGTVLVVNSGTVNVAASGALGSNLFQLNNSATMILGTAGTTNTIGGGVGITMANNATLLITNTAGLVVNVTDPAAYFGASFTGQTNRTLVGGGGSLVYNNDIRIGQTVTNAGTTIIENNGGSIAFNGTALLNRNGNGALIELRQNGSGTTSINGAGKTLGMGGQGNNNTIRLLVTGGLFQVSSAINMAGGFGSGINTNQLTQVSVTGGRLSATQITFGNSTANNANSVGMTNQVVLGGGTVTLTNGFANSFSTAFNAINGYTNQIIWNGGLLQAGGGNASFWSNMPNTLATISNSGGTFDVNGFSNSIGQNFSGTGVLTVINSANAAGTLTLSGSNAFGGLTVNGASVVQGSAFGLGSGSLDLAAGRLNLGTFNDTFGSVTFGNGTLSYSSGGGTLTASSYAATNSANVTLSNSLAGSGAAFAKSGAGTLTLSASNSYTGGTTINGGELAVAVTGALGSGAVTNNATLSYTGAGSSTLGNQISGTGGVNVGSGTLSLTGGLLSSGTVTVNGVLNLAGATSTPGLFAGSGTINQTAGTLTLASGSHSFGGAANLSGGTFNLAGANISSSTLSATGGTLTGTGTLGATTLGGTSTLNVSGGNGSAGTLTMGSLTVNGGTFAWNLFGTTGDLVNVTGRANFAGPQTITINNAVGTDWDDTVGTNYTILTAGSYTNFDINNFTVSNAGNAWANGNWSLSNDVSSGLVLVYRANSTAIVVSSDAGVITPQSVATNTVFADSGTPTPVVMVGAGEYILDMTNTYSGNTTIASGTLTAQNGSSFGNSAIFLGTTTNGNSNAALNINTAGVVVSNTVSVAGSGTNTITGTASGSVTYAGSVALGTNVTLASVAGGNMIITGGISGTGAATVSGNGTVTLAAANTYQGGTVLNGGTLAVSNNASLGSGTLSVTGNAAVQALASVTLTNNATVTNGVTATLDAAGNSLTESGNISGSGSIKASSSTGTGTVTLAGSNSYTGTATVNSGALALGSANALPSSSSLTVSGTGLLDLNGNSATVGTLSDGGNTTGVITNTSASTNTLTVGGTSASSFGGTIGGSLGMTMAGSGTLTLGGSNSYTGGTVIGGGVLALGNASALGSGSLAVNTGGTLDLGGYAISYGLISGSGVITNSTGAATLSLTNAGSSTLTTSLRDGTGSLALIKGGSGTLTITNAVATSGGVTVNGGVMNITGGASLANLLVTNTGYFNGFTFTNASGTNVIVLTGGNTNGLAIGQFIAGNTISNNVTITNISGNNVYLSANVSGASGSVNLVGSAYTSAGVVNANNTTLTNVTVSGVGNNNANTNQGSGSTGTYGFVATNTTINGILNIVGPANGIAFIQPNAPSGSVTTNPYGYAQLNSGVTVTNLVVNGRIDLGGSGSLSLSGISGTGNGNNVYPGAGGGSGIINLGNTYTNANSSGGFGNVLNFSGGSVFYMLNQQNNVAYTLTQSGAGSVSFGYLMGGTTNGRLFMSGGNWFFSQIGQGNSSQQIGGTNTILNGATVTVGNNQAGQNGGVWVITNGSMTFQTNAAVSSSFVTQGQTLGFVVGSSGTLTFNGTLGLNMISKTNSGGMGTNLTTYLTNNGGLVTNAGAVTLGGATVSTNNTNAITLNGGTTFFSNNLTLGGNSTTNTIIGVRNVVTLNSGTFAVGGTLAAGSGTSESNSFFWNGGTLALGSVTATNAGWGTAASGSAISNNTLYNTNAGIFAPGTVGIAGRASIAGSYVQSGNGVLALDVFGPQQAVGFQQLVNAKDFYDTIAVTGGASLSGDLLVNTTNASTLSPTNSFIVLTATGGLTNGLNGAHISGSSVMALDGFGSFRMSTNATTLTLTNYTFNQYSGSGTWGTGGTNSWTAGIDPNSAVAGAYLGTNGNGSVTLDADRTVSALVMSNASGSVLASSGGAVLSLTNNPGATTNASLTLANGNGTVSAGLNLQANLAVAATVGGSSTLTLSGAVAGSGGLTVASNNFGTILLTGTNSYSGATLVTGGTLWLTGTNALSYASAMSSNNLRVSSNAALVLAVGGANAFSSNQISTAVSGGVFLSGSSLGYDVSGTNYQVGSVIGTGLTSLGLYGSGTASLSQDNSSLTGLVLNASRINVSGSGSALGGNGAMDTLRNGDTILDLGGTTQSLGGLRNIGTNGTLTLLNGSLLFTNAMLNSSYNNIILGALNQGADASIRGSMITQPGTYTTIYLNSSITVSNGLIANIGGRSVLSGSNSGVSFAVGGGTLSLENNYALSGEGSLGYFAMMTDGTLTSSNGFTNATASSFYSYGTNLTFSGNIDMGAATVTLTNVQTLNVTDGTLTLTNGIVSAGALVKGGAGTLVLGGVNNSSSTALNGGTILATGSAALGNNLTLASGLLDLGGYTATFGTVAFNGNAFTVTNGAFVATNAYTASNGTVAINLGGNVGLTALAGTNYLTGSNSYTGYTIVTNGATLWSVVNTNTAGFVATNAGSTIVAKGYGDGAWTPAQVVSAITLDRGAVLAVDATGTNYQMAASLTNGSNFTLGTFGNGTVTLNDPGTNYAGVSRIAVSSGTLDLGGVNAPGQMTLTNVTVSGGTVTNGVLSITNLTVARNANATIAANLVGTGSLTIATGTLTLTGSNSYTNATLNAGWVNFAANSSANNSTNGTSGVVGLGVYSNAAANFGVTNTTNTVGNVNVQASAGSTATVYVTNGAVLNTIRNNVGAGATGANSTNQIIIQSGATYNVATNGNIYIQSLANSSFGTFGMVSNNNGTLINSNHLLLGGGGATNAAMSTNLYVQTGDNALLSNSSVYGWLLGYNGTTNTVNVISIQGGRFAAGNALGIDNFWTGTANHGNVLNVLSNSGGIITVNVLGFGATNYTSGTVSNVTNQLALGNGTLGAGTTSLGSFSNYYAATTGYTNQILWNGGVLQARANTGNTFWGNLSNTLASIGSSGGIFDINGFGNTISANLTGTGALIVTNSAGGAGTLTLSGANTYSGGTIIGAGILAFTTNTALGTNGVSNNATLAFTGSGAQSFSNTVTGSGAFLSAGTGTVTLSGANDYTGGTTLSSGVLALGSSAALGSTGTITLGGGTLQFSSANTNDYSSRFSTNASQAYRFDVNGRNVTLASSLNSSNGALTLTDSIGTGTLTLAASNSYSGVTTISSGTLLVTSSGAMASTYVTNMTGGSLIFSGNNTNTINGFGSNTAGGIQAASGTTATVLITNGAFVSNNNSFNISQTGAQNNSTNRFIVATNSTFINTGVGRFIQGLANNELILIANYGGTYQDLGGVRNWGRNLATAGSGSNSTVQFVQTGGSSSWSSNQVFGAFGSNSSYYFDVSGGTVSLGGNNFSLGGAYDNTTVLTNTLVRLSNGAANFTANSITFGNTSATNTLAGNVTNLVYMGNGFLGQGTTTINQFSTGYGSAFNGFTNQVIWNGGVLQAGTNTGANFFNNLRNTLVTIGDAGGIFDINGFGNTISANLTGSGALIVTNSAGGAGTLTLSGANTYSGGTIISGGTLQISANQTVASSTAITNNANLLLSTSTSYTVNGGRTLTLTGSGTTVMNSGTAIFQVNNGASLFITNTTLTNTSTNGGFSFGTGSGTITLGASTLSAGGAGNNGFWNGNGQTLIVQQGGLITNTYFKSFDTAGMNFSLILTNGGRISGSGISMGRGGNGGNILIGSTLGSQTSTFNVLGARVEFGGYFGNSGSSNQLIRISSNGLLTNFGDLLVANGGSNNQFNQMILTNGGVAVNNGSGGIYVGSGTNNNSNSIVITGNGSLLNAGGRSIYIGNQTNNGVNYGNNIQVLDGGVLSNAANVFLDNSNSSVTLSGGTLYANSVFVYNTNTLFLSNSGTTNGTIIARNNGTLISGPGTVSLTGDGTIDAASFNVTNSSTVAGAGNLRVNGAGGSGTLTLTGQNSYQGQTYVNSGTLRLANGGSAGVGAVNLASGTTLGYTNSISSTIDNDITVTSGTGTIRNFSTNLLTLSGTLTKSGSILQFYGGSYNVTGRITGSAPNSDLVLTNASVTLSGASDFNGPTRLLAGSTLTLGVNNALPAYTSVAVDTTSTLDIGSYQQTLAGSNALTGTGVVTGSGAGVLTLAGNTTFGGSINGGIGLTVSGASVNLSGISAYTGTTRITGEGSSLNLGTTGSLTGTSNVVVSAGSSFLLGASEKVNAAAQLTLDGGNLSMGGNGSTRAGSQSFASLTLTANSVIDFANLAGNSSLTFGSFTRNGNSLSIWNWSGVNQWGSQSPTQVGTQTRIYLASTTGLSAADFASISFYSGAGTGFMGNGFYNGSEIVPVPEPGVVIAALMLLGWLIVANRGSLLALIRLRG